MFFLSCKTLLNYSWAMCTLFSWQGVDNQKVEKHLNCRWKPLGYVHMGFFLFPHGLWSGFCVRIHILLLSMEICAGILTAQIFFPRQIWHPRHGKKVTFHVLTQILCENSIGHPGHELALLNGSNPWPNSWQKPQGMPQISARESATKFPDGKIHLGNITCPYPLSCKCALGFR